MAEGADQTSTISSSMNYDVNEQYLANLIEMGIDQEVARKALKLVNNRSLEDALAVIFGESTLSIDNTKEQHSVDAGRTEIESGSITCVGLFGTNEQLNPITGHLRLMQDCLKCSGN
ncbi:unnamed protein product [Rotaria sp. Silwood2]|nr:unnamed protein product [Rotaria sp. Silwood2]